MSIELEGVLAIVSGCDSPNRAVFLYDNQTPSSKNTIQKLTTHHLNSLNKSVCKAATRYSYLLIKYTTLIILLYSTYMHVYTFV